MRKKIKEINIIPKDCKAIIFKVHGLNRTLHEHIKKEFERSGLAMELIVMDYDDEVIGIE